jgi:membrane-associated protein
MAYQTFLLFSIIGALLWVNLFVLIGYFFGNMPFVKRNFSLVVIALVLIPGIPALIEFVRLFLERRNKTKNPQTER